MSLALLFSPQGSQAIGMGRALVDASPSAREVFERADEALGWSVSRLAFEGPEARLNDTRYTQPALVTMAVAAAHALSEALAAQGDDLAPAFVAGHSVGEYAALVMGEVLSLEDAVRLVAVRGELMAAESIDGGMSAVIGLDRAAVAAAIAPLAGDGSDLVIANDNAPGQVVISGLRGALAAAAEPLRAAGAKRVLALKVSGPFHSPHMRSVGERLARAFDDVTWSDARVPLISNVTADPVSDASDIRGLLARQVSAPVEWVACVERLAAEGVDTFVECGPGAALTGMVKRIVPGARLHNVGDPGGVEKAATALRAAEASV
ncbi:MAG: ACP S-malonyltransferase [Chloroflexota bacterium]